MIHVAYRIYQKLIESTYLALTLENSQRVALFYNGRRDFDSGTRYGQVVNGGPDLR